MSGIPKVRSRRSAPSPTQTTPQPQHESAEGTIATPVTGEKRRQPATPNLRSSALPRQAKRARQHAPGKPPHENGSEQAVQTLKNVIRANQGKEMTKEQQTNGAASSSRGPAQRSLSASSSSSAAAEPPEETYACSFLSFLSFFLSFLRNENQNSRSEPSFAPQVTIVNGQIVLNPESLVIQAQGRKDLSQSFNYVTEGSNQNPNTAYRRRKCSSEKWNKEETNKFYRALQMYGTDFTAIQLLFPTRTRRQIRNKFKKEEKDHGKRVDEALANRIPIDLEQYKSLVAQQRENQQASSSTTTAAGEGGETSHGKESPSS
ncbi:Transcription factor TFIIIB component B [Balamuthia mandrillaris]